ncbi:GMC oxidoreductase [Cecembia lonarensis]|uniref:Gluconate 2-dehydrogenase flavoprotein n=1 Tax=Cecembia lonarensis (strain CCUG 58316 / KCTC 22772 / LW9) TaxID=1225176 RepID=K1LB28_CECL9|nr:GMC family oxidoreductase [Cecembia lonarensis]EKB47603.1 Gluconate 2-dehydrogenase flavoprotein precursor [Cecembia lonarensis LW9]
MADNSYDAIVVGSGISGGWAAKELTEKGLKVLLLERGQNVEHVKDYKSATLAPWEIPHRGRRTTQMIENHPNLRRDYVLNELNLDWWAHESDSPYIEKKPFTWFRGYQVGGRSLLWGRQSYRLHDIDFEANLKEGIAVDWPIRYKDLAPWYSYAEKFAGISGNKDGYEILPDGEFQPPMPLNCVEKDVADRVKAKWGGKRLVTVGRVANLTQPLEGRVQCQFRNKCWLGCPFGGYFSTQSSTLPAAMKTGNLTLRPWSIVTKLIYDKDTQKATGVEVLDAENNQTYEYNAKIIFLCASAFNSTAILMRTATDIWPEGLGSSSGELGHNVMDHHFRLGANGIAEGYEDKYYFGRRPNGVYIPRFRNVGDDKRDYLRGFGYQGSASRQGWSRNIAEMNYGAPLKEALSEPGPWSMGITAFGEILPYHENTIKLSKDVKDKWGLSVLEMDAEIKENEKKMRVDMMNDAAEMLEAAGLKNVNTFDAGYTFGQGIHEMGTARMGRDPKTSVLNGNNQVWDAKNVFVTDGACMTSAAAQNPSLTYMALTARAADFAVNELKKGNL